MQQSSLLMLAETQKTAPHRLSIIASINDDSSAAYPLPGRMIIHSESGVYNVGADLRKILWGGGERRQQRVVHN